MTYANIAYYKTRNIQVNAGIALLAIEEFTDRYINIGLSGLNYEMFVIGGEKTPPFFLNVHVYSCILVLNEMPCNANQISNELNLNYMTVRHHLKLLLENHIIKSDGEEYGALYSVSEKFDVGLFEEVFTSYEKECSSTMKNDFKKFREPALKILKRKNSP